MIELDIYDVEFFCQLDMMSTSSNSDALHAPCMSIGNVTIAGMIISRANFRKACCSARAKLATFNMFQLFQI